MAVSLNCSVYLFMLKTQKVGWVSNFLGAVHVQDWLPNTHITPLDLARS